MHRYNIPCLHLAMALEHISQGVPLLDIDPRGKTALELAPSLVEAVAIGLDCIAARNFPTESQLAARRDTLIEKTSKRSVSEELEKMKKKWNKSQ